MKLVADLRIWDIRGRFPPWLSCFGRAFDDDTWNTRLADVLIFTSLLLGLLKKTGGKRRYLDGPIVAVRSETGRNGRSGSP